MVAKLVVEEGDLKGISLSLEEGESWIIGRDPAECQLVIEDPLVSRKHLIARRHPEGIFVENLSETNPVLLNDEELKEQPALLQNGDTLKIGNELLRFYEESSAQVHDSDLDDSAEFDDIDHTPDGESEPNDESEIDLAADLPQGEVEVLPDTAPDSSPIEEQIGDTTEMENEIKNKIEVENENDNIEKQIEIENQFAPPTTSNPTTPPPIMPPPNQESPSHDTIFGEDIEDDTNLLAEIDFGVIETGRWLLKVIGGPNTGAEFYMQAGNNYVIGTDPKSCDIVFHDTSVSRQHARITITPEEALFIEDLKSRNGVLINGSLIDQKHDLTPSTIVTLGTTSFVLYDREGEMQTIISPLLPSIVKVLQQDQPIAKESLESESVNLEPIQDVETTTTETQPVPNTPVEPQQTPKAPRQIGPYIVLSAIIGLFVLAAIGTSTLFHDEPVVEKVQANADELIKQALSPFPSIRWTYNKSNGSLLLLGHVATISDKNHLIYKLNDLKLIKSLDDSGIIIDEGVLNEVNSLVANNPDWKGIRIYSPEPGQFILSGTLKTRKQADQLSNYLNLNFPYLDLLKKQIVVEEDVVHQVEAWLSNDQFFNVTAKINGGEIVLSGNYPPAQTAQLNEILAKIKQIPGVRLISNQAVPQTAETGIIDISDHYQVSGTSKAGNKFTVVINGRILSEGDELDGMTITKITTNSVLLEKDKDRFRINY